MRNRVKRQIQGKGLRISEDPCMKKVFYRGVFSCDTYQQNDLYGSARSFFYSSVRLRRRDNEGELNERRKMMNQTSARIYSMVLRLLKLLSPSLATLQQTRSQWNK